MQVFLNFHPLFPPPFPLWNSQERKLSYWQRPEHFSIGPNKFSIQRSCLLSLLRTLISTDIQLYSVEISVAFSINKLFFCIVFFSEFFFFSKKNSPKTKWTAHSFLFFFPYFFFFFFFKFYWLICILPFRLWRQWKNWKKRKNICGWMKLLFHDESKGKLSRPVITFK